MTTHETEVISVWLDQPWPAGLIAIGGCDADGAPFSKAPGDATAAPIDEQCWLTLNEAIAQLDAYNFGEGQARWIFETAIIFSVRRSDGAWAAIVTPRDLSQSMQAAVESRLDEFAGAAA
jgi:hypothetical protein